MAKNLFYNNTKAKGVYYNGIKAKKVFVDDVQVFTSSPPTPLPLSYVKDYHSGVKIGNYALFVGGANTGNNAYDMSLTRINVDALGYEYTRHSSAVVGDYAIFAGGHKGPMNSWGPNDCGVTVAYNKSLTRIDSTALLYGAMGCENAGTNNDNYALFYGGYKDGDSTTLSNILNLYNKSLTRTYSALSKKTYESGALSINGCGVFFGGLAEVTVISDSGGESYTYHGCLKDTVIVNNSGTVTYGALNNYMRGMRYSSVSSEDYGLFAGGYEGTTNLGSMTDSVAVINKSLTVQNTLKLSAKYYSVSGANIGDKFMFSISSLMDIFDSSLVRSVGTPLSVSRIRIPTVSIGEYAIFAGGNNKDTIDVYDLDLEKNEE